MWLSELKIHQTLSRLILKITDSSFLFQLLHSLNFWFLYRNYIVTSLMCQFRVLSKRTLIRSLVDLILCIVVVKIEHVILIYCVNLFSFICSISNLSNAQLFNSFEVSLCVRTLSWSSVLFQFINISHHSSSSAVTSLFLLARPYPNERLINNLFWLVSSSEEFKQVLWVQILFVWKFSLIEFFPQLIW